MCAFIKAISYYLPEGILNNDDLAVEFPQWSADKISSKTGIFERRIAAEYEFASDLAVKAAEKLFEEYNVNRDEVDFLLLCTQSPEYFLPTTACILQNKLNLKTTCGALDFNLGCSGYVYGLSLAKGLISAKIAKNVLLITSETYSKFINKQDKGNRSLFGDAAAATLVTDSGGICSIEEFVLGTDGNGAENLIVKNGASRNRQIESGDVVEDGNFVRNDNNLYMNGGEIFSFTNRAVPTMVDQLMQKCNLKMDDISLFIFHQANEFMLNSIRRKMNIPEDKFFIFLKNCGNTVSSTIPIALHEAIHSQSIKKKDTVLLAGFGVGYSWGANILKF